MFSFSWKLLAVRSIGTTINHLGADLRMLSSNNLVLTSLLAVGTAVLTTWTVMIKVSLEVFTKQLCYFNTPKTFFSTLIRAAQLGIVTYLEMLVHMS